MHVKTNIIGGSGGNKDVKAMWTVYFSLHLSVHGSFAMIVDVGASKDNQNTFFNYLSGTI
jgi:hypothetical protein